MSVSKKICSVFTALLMLISVVFSVPATSVFAAGTPTLSAESKTVDTGSQFTVNVNIANASSVYNGNFTLQYDSSKLEVESYKYGSIFNEHTRNCNLNYQSTGNQIRFTFSGAYSLTGDGILVTFTFRAKENISGTSSLNFTAYKIYDENGISLSPTVTNGSVSISEKVSAKPELSVVGGTVNAGDTISVPVKIMNTESVYNGNFTLQYDSSLLTAEAYTYGSIFNEHTKNCNLNYQSTGNQIRFTFSGAYSLTGDGTLVTFTFRAKENVSGTSSLNFTAYKIYDENGVSLSATAVNGSAIVNEKSGLNVIKGRYGGSIDYEINLSTGVLTLSPYADYMVDSNGTNTPWENYKDNITSVYINDGIKNIGTNVFQNCENLTSVRFPYDLEIIGSFAFYGCSSLREIIIPNTVTEIGQGAFNYCVGLESIELPDTYISIGEYAFYNTEYSYSYNSKDGLVYIGSHLVCTSPNTHDYDFGNISIKDGTTDIAVGTFADSSNLISISLPTTMMKIECETFKNCINLQRVEISKSINCIDYYAFENCISLETVDIPENVEEIRDYAFMDCDSLQSIYFYNSQIELGNNILYECDSNALIIYGYRNSTAEDYANQYGINFVALDAVELSSISIATQPSKKTYYIGDLLNTSGLQLELTYSDGSTEIVSSGFTTSGFSLASAGTKTVTVSYEGLTTTFNVTVNTPSILLSQTSKTMMVGDTATLTATTTPSGQSVTWTSSNSSVASVSNGVVTAKASGTATITAKFTYNGKTYSKTCNITVNNVAKTLTSISISSNPTKTTYEIGESLNTSGLKLKLNYSDGSSEIVSSGFTTSGFDSSTAGTKTITVSYGGKSTTFKVTVNASAIDENAPQITMNSVTTAAGKEIALDLMIKNNPGIAGLAVSLKYDESVLTLKEVKNGDLFSAFTAAKNYIWDESENVNVDGKLATFIFMVAEDADAGDYEIEIITRSCANIDLDDVELLPVNSIITVTDFLYGDANGDGEINMKDVVLLRKYMANFDYDTGTSTVAIELGADANGDGQVNMKDVVLLRKYMANFDYDTGTSSVVLGPQ